MRGRRPALCLALALSGIAVAAPPAELRRQAVDCLAQAEVMDVSLDSAGAACEDFLAAQTRDPRWSAYPAPEDGDALRDLLALLEDLGSSSTPNPRLQPQAVAAILKEVAAQQAPAEPLGWWERFLRWLERLLQPQQPEHSPLPAWLVEWLRWIPSGVAKGVIRGTGAMLAALLLWLVWRELRDSGVLQSAGRTPRGHRGAAAPEPAASHGRLDWAALRRLPAAAQATAALRLVIACLAARGLLPDDRSLTNHQLHRYLARHASSLETDFRAVVGAVELELYGGHRLQSTELDALFARAAGLVTAAERM